jgi:hypothetical protein
MHYHLIIINDCQARGEECQENDQEKTSQHLEILPYVIVVNFCLFTKKNLAFRLTLDPFCYVDDHPHPRICILPFKLTILKYMSRPEIIQLYRYKALVSFPVI